MRVWVVWWQVLVLVWVERAWLVSFVPVLSRFGLCLVWCLWRVWGWFWLAQVFFFLGWQMSGWGCRLAPCCRMDRMVRVSLCCLVGADVRVH